MFSKPSDAGCIPIKGNAGDWRDKTETGMEQGMWVYMVAVVGAGQKSIKVTVFICLHEVISGSRCKTLCSF